MIVPHEDLLRVLDAYAINAHEDEPEIPDARTTLDRLRADAMPSAEEDEADGLDLDFEVPAVPFDEPGSPGAHLAAIDRAKGDLRIALLPCPAPWASPLAMRFGGWNACPPPEEHAAVLRDWHARHGAEPVVMGADTLELVVRPLREPAEAKRIAIEQYGYCSDIVDQGVGTVAELASGLPGLPVWFFWWD